MKKNLCFPWLALYVPFLIFISCTLDPEETNILTPIDKSIEKYDRIGITHNEGLDFIFGEIEEYFKNNQSIIASESMILEISESANKAFLHKYKLCDESKEYTYSHIEHVFNNQHIPAVKSFADITIKKADIQFTESLAVFLEKLHIIMLDNSIGVEHKITSIEQIETLSLEELSVEDLDIFLSATSVAKHTMTYWDTNLINWITLLTKEDHTSAQKSDFCWKSLAVEDVAGAIGGAAGAKVAAFFGPIGWKAMAGIIGGAATANSVKYAVATIMSEEINEQEETD